MLLQCGKAVFSKLYISQIPARQGLLPWDSMRVLCVPKRISSSGTHDGILAGVYGQLFFCKENNVSCHQRIERKGCRACMSVLSRNGSAGGAWAQQSELSIDSSVQLSNFTQMAFLPPERICVRLQLVV